jgi:cytochrome c oxidase subunit 2
VDGKPSTGPTFAGLFGSSVALSGGGSVGVDEDYIRTSILEPSAQVVAGYEPVMPSFQGRLNDREIDAIIAYLKTLQGGPGGHP